MPVPGSNKWIQIDRVRSVSVTLGLSYCTPTSIAYIDGFVVRM